MNTGDAWLLAPQVRYAVFDIDGTLSRTNIIKTYSFLKRKFLANDVLFSLWLCCLMLFRLPVYFCFDALSRDGFLRHFYRKFEKMPYDELMQLCEEYFRTHVTKLFIGEAVNLMQTIRNQGAEIVLVSMGISPLVKCYAERFGVSYHCVEIASENGRSRVDFAGIKNLKELYIRQFSPNEVIAIADSKHDREMLSYCKSSIIISQGKAKKWMREFRGATIVRV